MEHEVIIVGAGPAGSAAAITLAHEGHKVLLLDRHSFPRDKACGDGVLPGAADVLKRLGVLNKIKAANFYQISGGRVVSPGGIAINARVKPLKNNINFFIAPRLKFDAILQQTAVETGVDFKTALVQGPLIENGSAVGVLVREDQELIPLKSRLIIGADGTTSMIARTLLPRLFLARPAVIGIRAYLDNFQVMPNLVEFYSLKNIFPDFAWIFPTGPTSANVGLGVSAEKYKSSGNSLPGLLMDFLQSETISSRIDGRPDLVNIRTWPYILSYDKASPIAFPGALLAGDAAGFLDPLTGEGIRNALLSGLIAGETIHAFLSGEIDDYRSIYTRRCVREIGRIMHRSMLLKKMFLSSPTGLDRQFRLANRTKKITQWVYNSISTNFEFSFY